MNAPNPTTTETRDSSGLIDLRALASERPEWTAPAPPVPLVSPRKRIRPTATLLAFAILLSLSATGISAVALARVGSWHRAMRALTGEVASTDAPAEETSSRTPGGHQPTEVATQVDPFPSTEVAPVAPPVAVVTPSTGPRAQSREARTPAVVARQPVASRTTTTPPTTSTTGANVGPTPRASAPDVAGTPSTPSTFGDDAELRRLLDHVTHPDEVASDESLPDVPSREAVARALRLVQPAVQRCAEGESGVVPTKLRLDGATGRIVQADISGDLTGTSVAACVAQTLRAEAEMPRFARSTFSVDYPFVLR